jgi:hypothetical protein
MLTLLEGAAFLDDLIEPVDFGQIERYGKTKRTQTTDLAMYLLQAVLRSLRFLVGHDVILIVGFSPCGASLHYVTFTPEGEVPVPPLEARR